jgi:beta-mannosidase
MLSQCDPFRPYLPSSPYYSPEAVSRGNVGIIPEQHLWEPRDYYKSSFYSQTQAHFISEIGYHGCPNLSSIRKFIDEDHLWPWENNPQWVIHSSDPVGEEGPFAHRIRLMADQIHELFGFYPDNLEDFILASQISQAEANKFFIEMMRIKKWRRSGILWWNAVDGWPQFSDAVVDYYFGKKLAYHYIKRVQQPVCIMVDEPDSWHVRVVVGNDSLTDVHSTYRVWDADTHEVVMEGCFDVGANENLELGRIRISHGDKRLFLMEWTINGQKYGNHYMLSYPPVSFEKYKGWMKKIADLYPVFDAEKVGK